MTDESARILLVVHDPLESATFANSLSNSGCEIISCREIEAAEALLTQVNTQILITDISFPPLYGVEGIKLIQRMKLRFPGVLVVGLTGKKDDHLNQLFKSAKGSKLFLKPVLPSQIHQYLVENETPQFHFSARPGRVRNILKLEDFLRSKSIGSLLQPIVGIRKDNNAQILGVESLARAQPNHALWNPEMLFDYADRMEKTFETDSICIEAALQEASGLSTQLRLFLNVRPHSIAQDNFSNHLTKVAKKYGFEPDQIIIELTEQQTIANLEDFHRALADLRSRGFGFALDDFGAGYANLERLQSLRPDFLKLSGVFSRNLDTDISKQVIVKSSTQMAHRLEIPAILENIENQQELDKAKALGIDFGQGYHFSQPKSAKSLKDIIPGFHRT